ncbi:MAG: hypothetical protein ACREMQ_17790 [Longimicrobiales bacterium]
MRRTPITAALLLSSFAASPAIAQDIQYKTVTKLDLGAAINTVLKLAGASEVVETTYLKGTKLRTDVDKTSTIYDVETGKWIHIDHEAKTYVLVPIGEMMAAAGAMVTNSKAQAGTGTSDARIQNEEGTADFKFDFKVEATNERKKVNGQDAQRALLTVVTDIKVTPEDQTEKEDSAKIVLLSDTWNTTGGPAHEAVNRFQQAAVKEVVEAAFDNSSRLGAGLASDPKMAEAMKKAAAEARKIEGLDVLTTIYLVGVAGDAEFDKNLVLKPEAESGAKKAMGGLLRGALSGRQQQQQEEPKEPPKQATIMKMTIEMRDFQTRSLPASLFEVPAGYRQVTPGGAAETEAYSSRMADSSAAE